jgi:hypothetical protein
MNRTFVSVVIGFVSLVALAACATGPTDYSGAVNHPLPTFRYGDDSYYRAYGLDRYRETRGADVSSDDARSDPYQRPEQQSDQRSDPYRYYDRNYNRR